MMHRALLWGLVVALLAAALQTPVAGPVSALENPRLAGLQIEIWPEFDRPAALVILRAELSTDAALPAPVSLRIPASSGGPAAVAAAASADSELLNLPYERTDTDEEITLTFTAEQRFLHIEFYDRLETDSPERSYTYVWTGDFAAERASVRVQEPAAASDLSTEPEMSEGSVAADGLRYRRADLGALEAGETLPITVSYRKTDARTSAEILGLATDPPANAPSDSGDGMAPWLLLPAAAVALVVGAGLATLWHRRWAGYAGVPETRAERRRRGGPQASGETRFCRQCGIQLDAADRFCSRCGTPVRKP